MRDGWAGRRHDSPEWDEDGAEAGPDQGPFPEPDWARRIGVESRAASGSGARHSPLGDPTRWGAIVKQLVRGPAYAQSETIVRAQTYDLYPRTWTAIGTLKAPATMWALDSDQWLPLLELTMGAGQNSLRHYVNLKAVAALDEAVYNSITVGDMIEKAWVMGGGILALAINIRVIQAVIPVIEEEQEITTSVQLAPLAAGSGL